MNYYLDTCALKWRYLRGNRSAEIDKIILSGSDIYISDLTILEWSSALADAVKNGDIDQSVFKANETALFTDVASEQLKVFSPIRVIERARSFVEYIAVIHKRGLRTLDSIHFASAIQLSAKLKEKIYFVTADRRLCSAIRDFASLHLEVIYLVEDGTVLTGECS